MRILAFVLVAALAGCGTSVQTYGRVTQETGRELSTPVGGQVLKVERASEAAGGRSYTELRYRGLTSNGRAVFRVTEVAAESPRESTEPLPPNSTEFAIDPAKTREFMVAGIKVQIVSAGQTSLRYRLAK